MQMKLSILIKGFCIAAGILIISSCRDANLREPIEHSSKAPSEVQDVKVKNTPGGAVITYSMPSDPDLLYVKAEYTLATGQKKEVKSTYYNNSLAIEGFADTLQHQVQIYAVNRSEVASEPVTVTIHPLVAPIWGVFDSLRVIPAFGGIHIESKNPGREDVAILLMEKDEYGEWKVDPNSIYTSTDSIAYTIRGFDTTMHHFAVTVRDRWLNYTDTLYADIKPLFETLIPISGYKGLHLPGDAPQHKTDLPGMWDGDFINWPRIYMTEGSYLHPAVITFDIGELAKISRIVIWDYPEYYNGRTYYYQGCMKDFQIWGCTSNPSTSPGTGTDGLNFNNWFLLGTYHEVKPSGLPYGQQSNEDYQTANAGFSWDVDINAAKVRYIRIKCLKNWGGSENLAIAELRVYGDPR